MNTLPKESVLKREVKVKFPGQDFTEQELLDLQDRGVNLAVKGPFHIFRIKKNEKGKVVFDSKDRTQEDHWLPDTLEPFYEGYLHIGEDGKTELILLNAFPPQWLDERDQSLIAQWVKGYVQEHYDNFLGDEDFRVSIECVGEITV